MITFLGTAHSLLRLETPLLSELHTWNTTGKLISLQERGLSGPKSLSPKLLVASRSQPLLIRCGSYVSIRSKPREKRVPTWKSERVMFNTNTKHLHDRLVLSRWSLPQLRWRPQLLSKTPLGEPLRFERILVRVLTPKLRNKWTRGISKLHITTPGSISMNSFGAKGPNSPTRKKDKWQRKQVAITTAIQPMNSFPARAWSDIRAEVPRNWNIRLNN